MLRLRSLHRSNGAYYLMTTLAGGADPNGLVEADGRWKGSLAKDLAIDDAIVDQPSLAAAFEGLDPTRRQPLDARHERVSVSAIDCVFAAPKSVSVLHALGSDEVGGIVRQAHDAAVEGALGYLERHAAFVRRRGRLVDTGGLLAAAFVHRTSRAPDPHLHTHLLVANLGVDGEGRWSAIDGRPIYAQAGTVGSLYRASLRRAISDRLDISWERRVEGFADLVGISKLALRGFSQRSDEIDAELREAHGSSRRAKDVAANRTRRPKQLDVNYESLVRQWRERAFDLGISRSTLTRLSSPSRDVADAPGSIIDLARAVEASVSSFCRPFTRGELVRATSGRLVDGAPVEAVESVIESELKRAPLVRADERVAYLSGPRSGRFPSGVTEARYMTQEVAEFVRDRDDGLAGLRPSELALAVDDARAFERGGLVVPPTTSAYEFVRTAARSAHEAGRPILAFAASRVGAAHLEAVTGIEPEPWTRASTIPKDAFVVIDGPRFTPIRGTAELVALARSGRIAAVFLDGGAHGDLPRRDLTIADDSAPLKRFDVDGVRVVVAPDLTRLALEVRRLSEAARANGHEPIVVSARPDSIADLVGQTTDPRRLKGALDRHPCAEVIAVGPAAVLSRAIDDVADGSRTHILLSSIERVRVGRAAALGFAEPLGARRSLGRFPLGSKERARWSSRSEAPDRVIALDPVRPLDRTPFDRSLRRPREIGRDL